MKRFFLSLCFVTFLSAGLVSCADDAAEVTPNNLQMKAQAANGEEIRPKTRP